MIKSSTFSGIYNGINNSVCSGIYSCIRVVLSPGQHVVREDSWNCRHATPPHLLISSSSPQLLLLTSSASPPLLLTPSSTAHQLTSTPLHHLLKISPRLLHLTTSSLLHQNSSSPHLHHHFTFSSPPLHRLLQSSVDSRPPCPMSQGTLPLPSSPSPLRLWRPLKYQHLIPYIPLNFTSPSWV